MRSLTPGASYRIRLHWATFGDGGGRGFFNFFEDAVHKSAFDQGKMTGILVAHLVTTILLIVSVVGSVGAFVRYLRAGGSVVELLGAYRAGGLDVAAETLLKRDPNRTFLRDGTELISPQKGRAPVQAGTPHPVILHEPSEGGALVPKSSGQPVAASSDAVAKARQQVDTVTRKQLSRREQDQIIFTQKGSNRRKGEVKFIVRGMHLFPVDKLELIYDRMVKVHGVQHVPAEDGQREIAIAWLRQGGGDAGYVFGKGDGPGFLIFDRHPERATVIEEIIHVVQHSRLDFRDISRLELVELEVEAQDILIKLGERKGWTTQEIDRIKRAKEDWIRELREIE